MTENIFVVGSQVDGESQIGYERFFDEFLNILRNSRNNISITGLRRIGKTSLAKETMRRIRESSKEKVLIVEIDLAMLKSFSDMLVSVKNTLEYEIYEREIDEIIEDRNYTLYYEKLEKSAPDSQDYRDNFEKVFMRLAKLGYKIILMIDEFDKAEDFFETRDFEYLRNLASVGNFKVSLVLVSSRQVYMIERRNINNSTFHGILQTKVIDGFNDSDFALFYGKLKDLYGLELDEESRNRLEYYCGRSPYLLSMFAYDMVEEFGKNRIVDIDAVYRKNLIDINYYYDSIFECLKNDTLGTGAAYEISSMEKMIGIIFGPKIGITSQDIEYLETMGYLLWRNDRYQSISGHFTNTLLRKASLSVDTWKRVLEVEKKIKSMIRKQVLEQYHVEYIDYDLWVRIFEEIDATGTLNLYDGFISNSMEDYDCELDLLDVISLERAVSILKFHWEDWFSRFFNQDDWNEWEYKFNLCATVRNPMAHGHEEFVPEEEKHRVNDYCDSILRQLATSGACMDSAVKLELAENIRKRDVRHTYYTQEYSVPEPFMENRTVYMTAAEQDSKGIKGFFSIAGNNYKCTVGKNKWIIKYPNVPLSTHLGKEYEMKIVQVNQMGSMQVEFAN